MTGKPSQHGKGGQILKQETKRGAFRPNAGNLGSGGGRANLFNRGKEKNTVVKPTIVMCLGGG